MNLRNITRVAIRALLANKSRSALTTLGIVIGVSSVILLVSIGTGLKEYVTSQLEGLGADSLFVMPGEMEIAPGGGGSGGIPGAGVAASKFTFAQINDLKRKAQSVKAVMAYTENNGTMKYKDKSHITQVSGTGPEYPEMRDQKVISGTFFNTSQYNTAKKVVVLGSSLKEELFGEEDPLGKKIIVSNQRYSVIGVLEEKGAFGAIDMDDLAIIPATTAMRQFGMEHIQSLWVQSQSAETINQTKEEVEKILLESLEEDEFSVLDTKSILNVISNVLGVLTTALGGIAAISLVVGGIGIMNIMLVSVTERTREIGLRKAVGATPSAIMYQFLFEAVVLSVIGGLIGIMLGMLGTLVLRHFISATTPLWCVLLSFGVSAAVGVIFGVYPARRAARLSPIEALRYE